MDSPNRAHPRPTPAGAGRRRAVRARRLGRAGALLTATTVTGLVWSASIGALPQPGTGGDSAYAASEPAPEPESADRDPISDEVVALADAVQRHVRRSAAEIALPRRSGEGRRVVYSMGRQRVWLVRADDTVTSTYLVSGSIHDNLDPGRYEVYSKSKDAVAYDYSSTMRWFVRFTEGENAAIGFHSIPRDDDGEPVQTRSQLGTPLSAGCMRQRAGDARRLWRFAPVGTTVVVTAR